jgi:hypothetical protein
VLSIGLLQWPAMELTMAASCCMASSATPRGNLELWRFLAGDVLWFTWSLPLHQAGRGANAKP